MPKNTNFRQSIEAISKDFSGLYSLLCLFETHDSIQSDLVLAGSLDAIKGHFVKIWNDIDKIGEQLAGSEAVSRPQNDIARLLLHVELLGYWYRIVEDRSLADGLGVIIGELVENWSSLDNETK